MPRQLDAQALAQEIASRIAQLPSRTTPAVRAVRREYTRMLAGAKPRLIVDIALLLSTRDTIHRFCGYEILANHKAAFQSLTLKELLKLGQGIDSWSAVDCFACYLSGPLWRDGRIASKTVGGWARGEDPWWRRAALVSTVALSRRGRKDDVREVIEICALLTADREDLVVKALSWALRELAKKHPGEAAQFLADHNGKIAPRVVREVRNKLSTGLKNPRR